MSVPLDVYLDERDESQAAFARRSKVPQQTVFGVASGRGCNVSTAYLIVQACKDKPLPRGRTVDYEDLVPEAILRPAARRRRLALAARRRSDTLAASAK